MMGNNGDDHGGQSAGLRVPPGFRFHPTDEELLCYYLRKKVCYEGAIDHLDVIRELDLNKLEPWDLKEKCGIGCENQNEWYFFSHKDKKYPTGSRTNRATRAGFWKATGRDKGIHSSKANSKTIGMRKTLVFYTGRAPHGLKTDWIMHEYRLQDDDTVSEQVQEDGWVVCKVFKKKLTTISNSHIISPRRGEAQLDYMVKTKKLGSSSSNGCNQMQMQEAVYDYYMLDGCMQLPQLFSSEEDQSGPAATNTNTNTNSIKVNNNNNNNECTQTQTQNWTPTTSQQQRFNMAVNSSTTDWSFLNKLLSANTTNHQGQGQGQGQWQGQWHGLALGLQQEQPYYYSSTGSTKYPDHQLPDFLNQNLAFPYLPSHLDIHKFSKTS